MDGPVATNDECLDFMIEDAPLERASSQISSDRRTVRKRHQDKGVPVKAARWVKTNLTKLEQHEAVQFLRDIIRCSIACKAIPETFFRSNVGLDVRVSDHTAERWNIAQVENAGYNAGFQGGSRDDNPHDIGSEASLTWVKWFDIGLARAQDMGAETVPVSADRADPREEADAPPLEAAKKGGRTKGGKKGDKGKPAKPPKRKLMVKPVAKPVAGKRRGRPPGSKNRPKLNGGQPTVTPT